MKALIVDDTPINVKVAERLLSLENVETESVNNGKDCIEKIKSGSIYDVVFLDIMMPGMSGEETLQELKKIEGFNTTVIAMTAVTESGSKEHFLEVGFDYYLPKPISKESVHQALEEIKK